jgi:hypothetical protein
MSEDRGPVGDLSKMSIADAERALAWQRGEPVRTDQEQQAYELGAEHARNAASWVIDGNTSSEHVERVVKMMDEGDPALFDWLPREPNLSGEMSDDPTPTSLYAEIIGTSHEDAEEDAGMAYETLVGSVVDSLCDAYEAGVSDTFLPECERILRAAMPTTEDRLTEYVEAAFPHYVECALWTSIDEQPDGNGGPPMDDNYGPEDIAPEAQASMREDIAGFVREAGELLDDVTPEMAGHDFWLTRNRHGAGFWDRCYGVVGDRLTDIAHGYGESYLYVSSGRIYVS